MRDWLSFPGTSPRVGALAASQREESISGLMLPIYRRFALRGVGRI